MDEIDVAEDDRGFEKRSSLYVYIEEAPLGFVLFELPDAQVFAVAIDMRS